MGLIEIEFSRSAVKTLQQMDKKTRDRIHCAIIGLTEIPPKGDIKQMAGTKETLYRLRVGGYRVIYCYNRKGEITVLYVSDIGTRGGIYK